MERTHHIVVPNKAGRALCGALKPSPYLRTDKHGTTIPKVDVPLCKACVDEFNRRKEARAQTEANREDRVVTEAPEENAAEPAPTAKNPNAR